MFVHVDFCEYAMGADDCQYHAELHAFDSIIQIVLYIWWATTVMVEHIHTHMKQMQLPDQCTKGIIKVLYMDLYLIFFLLNSMLHHTTDALHTGIMIYYYDLIIWQILEVGQGHFPSQGQNPQIS
ncbi:hypothetical protein ACJX0J_010490, partial [Zea mays]